MFPIRIALPVSTARVRELRSTCPPPSPRDPSISIMVLSRFFHRFGHPACPYENFYHLLGKAEGEISPFGWRDEKKVLNCR
jgi:hypothetical protein